MAAQTGILAGWETDYAVAEKTLKALVTTLAIAASEKPELEQQLKTESEQRTMWQDLFVESRTEITRLKGDQAFLQERNAALSHDKEAVETELARLKEELSNLSQLHRPVNSTDSSCSVVLIDGDGLIFDSNYLKNGSEGGKEAALALRNGLTEHLSVTTPHVRICLYLNKLGLTRALMEEKIVSPDEFDAFLKGFQAAHTSTSVIDVGSGKEAADAKIRDSVAFYLGLAECKLVVLGASHDNGYSSMLSSLRTEGKISRVRILKGYDYVPYELKEFEELMREIPGLFLSEKLGNWKASPRSVSPVSPTKSPKQPVSWSTAAKVSSPTNGGSGQIVAFKSIKKPQVTSIKELEPRPCYAEYLRDGCTRDGCKYGHNYELSKSAMLELAKFAKRISCDLWVHDLCPYTQETCINGHVCPQGHLCPFRGTNCYFQKWHDENPSTKLKC